MSLSSPRDLAAREPLSRNSDSRGDMISSWIRRSDDEPLPVQGVVCMATRQRVDSAFEFAAKDVYAGSGSAVVDALEHGKRDAQFGELTLWGARKLARLIAVGSAVAPRSRKTGPP